MRLDWFGFAEGAATDITGKVTLVGFSPPFLLIATYPTQVAPVVVLKMMSDSDTGEPLPAGGVGQLRLEVLDEDSIALFATVQPITVGTKRYPALPGSLEFIAQVAFPVAKPGQFTARVTIDFPGSLSFSTQRVLLVADPSQLERTS